MRGRDGAAGPAPGPRSISVGSAVPVPAAAPRPCPQRPGGGDTPLAPQDDRYFGVFHELGGGPDTKGDA